MVLTTSEDPTLSAKCVANIMEYLYNREQRLLVYLVPPQNRSSTAYLPCTPEYAVPYVRTNLVKGSEFREGYARAVCAISQFHNYCRFHLPSHIMKHDGGCTRHVRFQTEKRKRGDANQHTTRLTQSLPHKNDCCHHKTAHSFHQSPKTEVNTLQHIAYIT